MKLLIICLLFPLTLMCQYHQRDTSLDSLANANICKMYILDLGSTHKTLQFRPYEWVKFTFVTRLNSGVVGGLFDGDDLNLSSLGTYDIRMKLYLSRDVRFLTRYTLNTTPTGVLGNKFLSFGFCFRF